MNRVRLAGGVVNAMTTTYWGVGHCRPHMVGFEGRYGSTRFDPPDAELITGRSNRASG